ncbi:hypothetical protein U1Q18_033453 [Sarracenia purpurea var. burkii]
MILRDMKMGLDVKGMQVCIVGVLNLFISSSLTFVKKYPFVSGVLFFFFLLYLFLPSVFTFLIFSVPVLVFIVVAFRLIFRIHQQNLEKAKGEKRNYGISAQNPTFVEDDVVVDKEKHFSIQRLSVRRRNAKEKGEQFYAQVGVEEKYMVIPTIATDALVDKTALIEENPKEIQEVMVDSMVDRTESSSAASQWQRHERDDGSESELKKANKLNGRGRELEAESSEDGEDEDEEGPEDGNKAVEWTEDDQKNLMDLGISEMERNKRLESLIARRRARKLLSMQARRTLMNASSNDPCGQIASLLMPIRSNNQFPPISSGEAQVSPTPGSAPSVLLPMHNPFDLPYDPQEEKPNLTGGSFQEEFMPANQKDMMFCRHESFSLGAFFPGPVEFDQSRSEIFYYPNFHTRQRISEIPDYSRLRNQSGKEDPSKLIQTEPFQECKPSSHDHARQQGQTASEQIFDLVGHIHYEDDGTEVHKESNLVREATGGSSSSSSSLSSEVTVPFSIDNTEEMLNSFSFSVPKNVAGDREYNADQRNELLHDSSPSSFGKKRPDERFFFADKRVNHTPTHSIASDLQVEVSEVSSPELTIDGTISPEDSDRGSPINYEGDADGEKETTSGTEEMWVASSQLSRVEENESISREVHEISEQEIIEVGFSRINQKSDEVIVASEKAVEKDHSIEDTSASSSKTELPKIIQTHSTHFNGEVHTSYSSERLSSEKMASLTLENALQSSEISEAHSSHHSNSGNPEGRYDSPKKSAPEANIIYDVNDQVVYANDHKEILEFIKDTYGEAPVMVGQGYNNLIPSAMLPDSVAEQVPNSLSSSSSPKSDTRKIVSVGQASSPSIDPEMNLKVLKLDEEIVESNFLDKLQPENLAAPCPQNAQDLSFESATYTSHDKDMEELQEPSNSPKKSTEDLNSIYVVNDSEVLATDVMVNMKTNDDIIGKGHILAKEENSGVYSKISEESMSNCEPIVKNGNVKTFEDSKGEYLELAKCDNIPESSNTEYCENNDSTLETSQQCEQNLVEVGVFEVSPITNATVESGLAGFGRNFVNPSDPNPQALFPQVVVEEVPIISRSPSPKSVLQNKFSMDQASLLSFEQEMEENTMLNGLPPENLAAGVPQNALHLIEEDSMAPLSNSSYSGSLQEPFSPPADSTIEDTVDYINDSASNEKEEKLDSKSPIQHDENSGTIKKIEKFGESLIFQDVEDSSMPSHIKHNSEVTEVVEDKSRTLTALEDDVDGLSEPVDKTDVSNIPATSEEREADRGRSTEEDDINSNDNEFVADTMVGEEEILKVNPKDS